MDFLDVLTMLKKENGLNNHSLSIATGIPYTTIDGWYKKGYDRIKLTTLRTLCQYFNVSLDFLIDGKLHEQQNSNAKIVRQTCVSSISPHELGLIKKYRTLDEYGIKIVDLVISTEYDRCTNTDETTE